MTDFQRNEKKERTASGVGSLALTLLPLCLLPLLLWRSAESGALVTRGLALCVRRVIPSLFPFMTLSALLRVSHLLPLLSRPLHRPARALFGMSGECGSALLLGYLCGFPVAAEMGFSLYGEGRIGRDELCRLLRCANVPGAAFLIGGVGASLFGDPLFGLALYLLCVLSAMLMGMAERLLMGRCREHPLTPPHTFDTLSFSSAFTEAVSSSARAMVPICGFVVFFTVLTGLASLLLSPLLPTEPLTLLLGSLEMTQGAELAAACPSPIRYYLVAFFVGFSGFSVHFQLASLGRPYPFFFKSYLPAKLLHGILTALLTGVLLYLRLHLP